MEKLQVLNGLLDRLWKRYQARVPYAAEYAKMVRAKGGTPQNDHIAFRTLNLGTDQLAGMQPAGIEAISRIVEPLGYSRKERYLFPGKKLLAWHYEHEKPGYPKLFISQLEVAELGEEAVALLSPMVENTPDILTKESKALLVKLGKGEGISDAEGEGLISNLDAFFVRPWPVPTKKAVLRANEISQYAAWTLLHGNSVNHFTAYINKQNVAEWPDIAATATALKEAGIPMMPGFEGEPGSKLRQTSTRAVNEMCDVIDEHGKPAKLEWSYAYYELAERGMVAGPGGEPVLFEAFLGEQATNLFEVTKRG